jgi:hypothetical protein
MGGIEMLLTEDRYFFVIRAHIFVFTYPKYSLSKIFYIDPGCFIEFDAMKMDFLR